MMLRAAAICVALLACHKHEPRTYQVAIKGMQFVPAELSVEIGDTVVWTNEDILPHTVTSGIPAPATFDSREIASKKQWSLTVSAAGEYTYNCTYHPPMTAKLIVR
ncbi:MAG TPA: cupredoxin family copper-binding protein [Kofleriaceae bacterium]|nr:cupredoxin family copper-binding protein [Kofleriaceae bacterium]